MRNLTIRMMITACLFCCAFAVNAKDVYVSATGDDSKDGLSATTAKKSLSGIDAILEAGDVINISGTIDINAEPDAVYRVEGRVSLETNGEKAGFYFKAGGKWKDIKFVGKDNATDGFTGSDKTRLFFIDGGIHEFENLFFKKGRLLVTDGGNALWTRNATLTFTNCIFEDNTSARNDSDPTKVKGNNGRGGVMRIMGNDISFNDCHFSGNENQYGGALYVEGGIVNISGCTFEDHDISTIAGSSGAVIYTWAGTRNIDLNIDNTLFKGSKAAGEGGAIAMKNLTDKNFYTKVNISNTAFIGNVGQRGGALFLSNNRAGTTDEVVIKNTTFFGNHASVDGGTICLWHAQPGSSFTMTNCTMAGNSTDGNAGHGAGLVVMDNETNPAVNMLKRFYNCIFDSNYSYSGGENFSDVWFRAVPGQDRLGNEEVEMKNCYIAWGKNVDNATYPSNEINYCLSEQEEEQAPVLTYVNAAGLVDKSDIYYYGANYYAIPLLDDAPARLFGDAAYLTQFGIESGDQFGKIRTISGGKSVTGAVEVTVDEFDGGHYDVFPPIATSVESSEADALDYVVIQNNTISLSSDREAAFIVYNLSGSAIKAGVSGMNIADLPSGVYIVKVKSDMEEFTQKIVK